MIQSKTNLVLITSIIDPPNTALSYSYTRSVYTREERFEQTKMTINTIKNKVPNSQIMMVECSNLKDFEKEYFLSRCEIFINLYDRNDQDIIDKIYSPFKAQGEGTMTIEAIKYLKENTIQFENFFKISGRYWLNDHFHYEQYDNPFIVYRVFDLSASTCLYKLPQKVVELWHEYLILQQETMNHLAYEEIFYHFTESLKKGNMEDSKSLLQVSELGVSGNVAIDGVLVFL